MFGKEGQMPKFAQALLRLVCLAGLLLLFGLPAEAAPASIYTVISTLDTPDAVAGNDVCADSNGVCTLRAAVMEANAHVGPDTIMLPADTFHLTRAGAGEDLANIGDLDITSNVTLQGMGPAASIVDAGPLGDRAFDVHTGASVSLSQITIQGGILSDGPGGGVQNSGTLTLSHVLITKNNLTGSQSQAGGGIANQLPGVLALTNSQVISNAGFSGGGISNLGQMTISASQVSTNTARYGAGVTNAGGLVINTSQVLSNTAGENIGGIFNTGQLAVSNSTIQGNRAPSFGGGLASFGSASRMTISGSAIRDNASAAAGGGVWAADSAPVTITASTLNGNHAGTLGGGVYV
jgi:hypothetical protein